MILRWPTQNQRRHFTSRVSGKKRSKTRTKSWRHLLPKRHSPPDEVSGRRPKVKSSARTGRLGLHHRARAGTHFDGANERGWNAHSAHLAKSRNAEGIDCTHDLFAIRHTARRFHRGLSQQLTSDFRPPSPPPVFYFLTSTFAASSDFCPPSSVLCPLSSFLRPLSSVLH